MKKAIKYFICFILIISITFTYSATAFATPSQNTNSTNDLSDTFTDYYSINYTETLTINGDDYQFIYYYDESNNRCVDIINNITRKIETIRYHVESGTLYKNDQLIPLIQNHLTPIVLYDANWTYFASSSKTITELETFTVEAFAVAIAAIASPYCTAAAVISAVGTLTLERILSKFENATVDSIVYKFNSNLTLQFRYDWSLTPVGGSKYGPYMTLSPIM